MLVLLLTIIGFRKLSIIPTIATDHIKNPNAAVLCPVAKRKIIAGADIKAVPIVGTRDAMPATTPHNAPLGIPKIQNPTPIKIPCRIAIKIYPFNMALVVFSNLKIIFLSSLSESGLNFTNA